MSKVVCIIGESGSGKTTSCRNLDPKQTFYIDADRKGLSWKGWKEQYNSANKNYKQTSNVAKIISILDGISKNSPHIKYIVIDTLNTIMVDDEVARMKEKGYDKWQDLAMCVWELCSRIHLMRDDLTVIIIAHSQTERDENGFIFTRMKTSGKKLDKIALESKFTTVLLAKCVDGKHVFETKSKNSTVKTPMGSFENDVIENDIVKVLAALTDY